MMKLLSLFMILDSSIFKKFNFDVITELESIRASIIGGKLAAFGSIAAICAALLCAVALIKISHDYLNGQGITLWMVIRPIVLLILCCNFGTFVVRPIHSFCNIFTRGMRRQVQLSASSYAEALGKVWNISNETSLDSAINSVDAASGTSSNEPSVLGGDDQTRRPSLGERLFGWVPNALNGVKSIGEKVSGAVTETKEFFTGGQWKIFTFSKVLSIAEVGLLLLGKLWIFGQQVTCYVYLAILALIGPFAFALAIIPSYQRGVADWIATYIQTALWIPVGQMMMYINYTMLLGVANGAVKASASVGSMILIIVCLVVVIKNIRAVPQICALIISATGISGAAGAGSAPTLFSQIGRQAAGEALGKMLSRKRG